MAEQAAPATGAPHRWRPVTSEAPLTRVVLTGVVLAFLGLFLVLPLAAVFAEALRKGGAAYLASLQDSDALAAIRLTLTVAAIAVPLNLVFGIAAAWAIAKFDFPGKSVLIPLMQEQGTTDEEAALTLGASPVRTFLTVALPNIRWALLYGVLLCNARAMGEFGAVSVVSGHVRGMTNTMPLHVEVLYNEY